jgi:AraC-like DNA-binding protein
VVVDMDCAILGDDACEGGKSRDGDDKEAAPGHARSIGGPDLSPKQLFRRRRLTNVPTMSRQHTVGDLWRTVSVEIIIADLYPCLPEWKIDPYTSTCNGLFYIMRGHGWVERSGKRTELKPGDLALNGIGHQYSYGHDPRRPITAYSLAFMAHAYGAIDAMRYLDLPEVLRLPESARREVEEYYQEAVADHHAGTPWSTLAARGSVLRLLALTLRLVEELPADRRIGRSAPLPGEASRSAAVIAFIDENLKTPLTLSQLARVAHLSPIHFAKEFRRQSGQSPMAFVRQRRVERAKALLAGGAESVEAVAAAVGFDDPYHFSRVFRKLTGTPPSTYRQSIANPFSR